MNLGFIVEKLGTSQLSFCLVRNANKILENPNNNVTGFKLDYDFFIEYPKFSILEAVNAWTFRGILVSTNIRTTAILNSCILASKKYFYVWDLEWIYKKDIVYSELVKIYQNPTIELIARTDSHAKIIEKCWKKPKIIMENFNYEQLLTL